MPVASFKRRSKIAAIVPLTLLCGAWTVTAVTNTSSAIASGQSHHRTLPDGTKVPTTAIQAPATLPSQNGYAGTIPLNDANQVIASASTSGIPAVALNAYEHAAQIINSADTTCNIPWELIAAIGRVESDHGRTEGNHLTNKGFAVPGIYGPVLDGKNGTQLVMDTDHGRLDHNTKYDRAVGPMQFLPSTWEVVQVDADGDGKRDPQDINDASLAAAVYLCSGTENLANRAGEQSAVFRYNHSQQYVNLVLRIMEAYEAGDYSSVPSSSFGGTLFAPSSSAQLKQQRAQAKANARKNHGGSGSSGSGGSSSSGGTSSGGGGLGSITGGGSGSGNGSSGGGGSTNLPTLPVPSSAPAPVKTTVKTLNQLGETTNFCTTKLQAAGFTGSQLTQAVTACAKKVGGMTEAAATKTIPTTPTAILEWLGLCNVGVINLC